MEYGMYDLNGSTRSPLLSNAKAGVTIKFNPVASDIIMNDIMLQLAVKNI